MEDSTKFVDFGTYCKTCKNEGKTADEEPCDRCLEVPAREGTEVPECWIKKFL